MPPELLAMLPQLIGMGGGSGEGGGNQGTLSSVTGLLQQLQANKLKKQADSEIPGMVDPNQAGFLSELQQKRKSLDTGAGYAAGQEAINSSTAGTNEALVRATGGDVGGTIQALLQSQKNAGIANNNLYAQGAQQQMAYTGMYNQLNNAIAARKLQLGLYRSQQDRAEWAQKQQMANQNLMAGLGIANSGQSSNYNSYQGAHDYPQFGTTGAVNPNAFMNQTQQLNSNPLQTAIPDLTGFAALGSVV